MRVLVLGATGQLGWELFRTCPENVCLHTCDYPKVDFTSESSLLGCLSVNNVDWVINAAAYTAVDDAEKNAVLAYQINEKAVEIIARFCLENDIRLVHISTDFIFNGLHHKPYLPEDTPDPRSVYGFSKLAGEQAIERILGKDALIIRTAWLYSVHGKNFVKTMIQLMKTKAALNIVDDQIGTPTWANGLAKAVWTGMKEQVTGVHHWTDAGVASWYDFAVAVQEEALAIGLLDRQIPLMPVGTHAFPRPAERPHFSVLDKTGFWQAAGITPIHWRKQLRSMLAEVGA
ncbi:MAG: dTDP-4-dehydrorhamnose reductase [Desulfobacterales bacterium]|nr:dTDP-4-dehydrorhamnose reductase [Desulfobacterales bacterium]